MSRKNWTRLLFVVVFFGLIWGCSAPEETGEPARLSVAEVEPAELPGSVERWLESGHTPGALPPHLKSGDAMAHGDLCGDPAREAVALGSAKTPLMHFHNVGDLDGDGHDDLLVVLQAAHGWPSLSPSRDGRAFLFYGPVTPDLLPLSLAQADAEFRLDITRAAFGTLAFGAGDLTGNGVGDLVLGTPVVDMERRRGHAARWPGLPGFLERWRGGVVFVLEGRSERYSGVVDVEAESWAQVRGVGRLAAGRQVEPGLGGYGHALDGEPLGCSTAGAVALALANSSEVLLVCGEALTPSGTLLVTPDLVLPEGMAVLRYPERHGAPRPPHFGFSRRAAFGHAIVEVGEDVVLTVPVAEGRGVRVRTELAVVGRDHLVAALAGGAEVELDVDAAAVRLVTYESTRRRVFTALHALDDGRVAAVVDSLLPGPAFIHAVTLPQRGAGVVGLHEVRHATLTLPWPEELALGAGAIPDADGLAGTFHGAARPFLDEDGRLSSLVFLDQEGAAFQEATDGAGVPAEHRMEAASCTGGVPLLQPGHAASFAQERTPGMEPSSRLWLLPVLDFPHPFPWLVGQPSSRYWVEEALHCSNGVLDGNETGVDCGGRCGGCPIGAPCAVDADCETLACGAGICVDPDEACEGGVEPNACGGCEELPEELGSPCGECGLGSVICAGPDAVECTGDPGPNACGGCAILPVEPGDPCGPCELDTAFCDGEDAVGCSGSTFANACGTCGIEDFCSPPADELPDDITTILGGGPATSRLRYTEGWMELVSGPSAVVRDADPEVFREGEMSLVTGRVELLDGSALGGARVRVLGQPGYGWTYTDSQGRYVLLVNGGDRTTLDFTAAGHHRLQRHVVVPWNEIWGEEPVVMTRASTSVSRIRLQGGEEMAVAVGDLEVDGDGARQAVMIFPPDTEAELVYPDGTRERIEVFDFRMTEFTVGDTGPAAMPAPLPPETVYTYAVELTVDQAVARGAETVAFGQPVFNYVHDFLGFGVGEEVPNGFLNRRTGDWEADWNGRVVEILAVVDGLAVLDVTGEGPATQAELEQLGITDAERRALASTHQVGDVLWRVPLTTFSAKDYNVGWGGDEDVGPPPCSVPEESAPGFAEEMLQGLAAASGTSPPSPVSCDHEPDERMRPPDECNVRGSLVNVQDRSLSRSVPLPGGLSLLYRSDSIEEGSTEARTIRVPLRQGRVLEEDIEEILVRVRVAGQVHVEGFDPATAPEHFEWTWDGLDALGRPMEGVVPVRVSVGYAHRVRMRRARQNIAFGFLSEEDLGIPVREAVALWRNYDTVLELPTRAEPAALARGWTIAGFDQAGPTRSGSAQRPTRIEDFLRDELGGGRYHVSRAVGQLSGPGNVTYPQLAGNLALATVRDLRRFDGGLLIVHGRLHEDARHAGGQVILNQGFGSDSFDAIVGSPDTSLPLAWDGALASEARLASLSAAAVHARQVYFAEPAQRLDGQPSQGAPRVWRWDEVETRLRVVAGGGGMDPGEALRGTEASLEGPLALDVAGTAVYIGDQSRILRLDGNGFMGVVAGTGERGCDGDGGDARQARVDVGEAMRVNPEGEVVFFDRTCRTLRRVREDGTIERFGGTGGGLHYPPDIGQTLGEIDLPWVEAIAFSPSGRMYISVLGRPSGWTVGRWESVIVSVDPNGTVRPAVGQAVSMEMLVGSEATPVEITEGEGRTVRMGFGVRMVVLGDESIFYSQLYGDHARIMRAQRLRGLLEQGTEDLGVPSRDGQQVHMYSRTGLHLATRDARTGRLLRGWLMGADGLLSGVEDAEGRVTTILREGANTTVTDEDGNTAQLVNDTAGRLSEVWATGSSAPWRFEYFGDTALLASVESPRGEQWVYGLDGALLYNAISTPESIAEGRAQRTLADVPIVGTGPRLDPRQTQVETADMGMLSRLWWSTDEPATREAQITIDANGIAQRALRATLAGPELSQRNHTWREEANGTVTWRTFTEHPFFGRYVEVPEQQTVRFPMRDDGSRLQHRTDFTHAWSAPPGTTDFWEGTWEETSETNGRISSSVWVPQTRTTSWTSPEGRTITMTFDALGRPLVMHPDGWASTEWSWDGAGRLERLREEGVTSLRDTLLRWDDETGLLEEVEDALGRVTRYEYDDRRLPSAMVYPDGRRVEMLHDDVGNLVELRVPSRDQVGETGEVHGFGWSSFHGMTMYEPPSVDGEPPAAVSTRRVYDLAQRLSHLERPDGRTIEYGYNGARLHTVTSDDDTWTHGYDPITGQLVSIAGPHGNTLGIDWYGTLPEAMNWASSLGGTQGRLSWEWGEDLVPLSETIDDLTGRSITLPLTYDDDLLPTGTGPLSFTLDPERGSITALTLGNATGQQTHNPFGELDTHATQVSSQDRYAATHTRDAIGRISEMVETVWRGGVLETTTFTYHYDAAGRLESVDEDGVEAWRWQWDGNSNRIGALDALDPAGEIVSADVEIDAQDRLMRYGEEVFAYNLNAEMVTRTVGSEVTTYEWSVFGNLERVMLPDGAEIDYELDPTGRRVGRSVDGERTHGWIYRDHLNPVAQLDAQGRLEQVYLYGTQPHAPDAILEIGAGGSVVSTYRVVTDVRGSVRMVLDADTGAVMQELRYSPFGEVLHDSNPGFQPFGFAGGIWDTDTSLVRFGAREYDARLGRWLSRDPILFDGGDPNLFGYVLGDPVNWVDPEGLVAPAAAPLIGPVTRALIGCGVGAAAGYTAPQHRVFPAALGHGSPE